MHLENLKRKPFAATERARLNLRENFTQRAAQRVQASRTTRTLDQRKAMPAHLRRMRSVELLKIDVLRAGAPSSLLLLRV